MSILYITEFSNQGTDILGRLSPIASLLAITTQTVAITGASVQSAALNANTTIVRLHVDIAASFDAGLNPTATTSKNRMPLDSVEYFGVQTNSNLKIAVIAN